MITQGQTPNFDKLSPFAQLTAIKAVEEVNGRGSPAQAEALLISAEEAAAAMIDPLAEKVHKTLLKRFEEPEWYQATVAKIMKANSR